MSENRNTSFIYRYRDGGNNKVSHRVVFAGAITLGMRDELLGGLIKPDDPDEWGDFIPGQVGLKDLQASFNEQSVEILEKVLEEAAGPVQAEVPEKDRERYEALLAERRAATPKWTGEDHPIHEVVDISLTESAPTEHSTIAEFIDEVMTVRWDPGYLPSFHAEMVENQRAHEEAVQQNVPEI